MLEVVEAGLQSTIQDRGRTGWGHLGVRRAGAADPLALAVADALVGNRLDAPAIEMSLLGGTFAVAADVLVGLAGADMGATVPEESRRLEVGASHRLRAGTTLAFSSALAGARSYLAVGGGFDVPSVLGSASTDLVGGLGGIEGRALQPGDVLRVRGSSAQVERRWPESEASSGVWVADAPLVVSVLVGPHREALAEVAEVALVEQAWTVSTQADRVGLRLEGRVVDGKLPELVSLPMLPGAVQLPPSGRPIVLLPDAPTVGGYPVPAVVAHSDQHRLGQLRPGDTVSFRWTSLEAARRAADEQAQHLASVAGSLA